jgi:hypothetical protein
MLARDEEPKGSSTRTRTRRSKRAVTNGQGSGAPEQMAQDHTTPDNSQSREERATIGIPAPHHDEDAAEPVTDAGRPIEALVPADHVDSVSVERTRCGWCGGTQFSFMSKESGQIYCTCGSIYRPSSGQWEPGDRNKRQSPPVSVAATDCTMQDEIERGTSEAAANSTTGDGALGDEYTTHQAPPARPHDDGETNNARDVR